MEDEDGEEGAKYDEEEDAIIITIPYVEPFDTFGSRETLMIIS